MSADFTEASYAALLDAAKTRFAFRRFGDDLAGEGIALWRHDIDFSPHRALALAQLEAERGVTATYFVLLGSAFYNAFEPAVARLLKDIASLGHDIGLHYDAAAIDGTLRDHEAQLAREADSLAALTGQPVKAFSLHNPSVSPDVRLDAESHAGLLNATSPMLRERFEYCSDSNGLWRFRSLHDVVADPAVHRLYALTHAEWWTPQALTPAEKLQRCIDGRAERVAQDYWQFLARHRPEIIEAQK